MAINYFKPAHPPINFCAAQLCVFSGSDCEYNVY